MAAFRKNTISLYDPAPHIPSAGATAKGDVGSAGSCIAPMREAYNQRPETPSEIKKYRQSFREQPGLRYQHHGFVGQPLPESNTRFGVKTAYGERIGDCLNPTPQSQMQAFMQQQKEANYRSNVREPVGAVYSRGHALPAKTRDLGSFEGFGIKTTADITAGSLIHYAQPEERSLNQADSNPFTQERVVTKPLTRNYDWQAAKVDPKEHRFGKQWSLRPDEVGGVASALQRPEAAHETVIVKKSQEEVRRAKLAPMGRTRNVKDHIANLPEDHTFGKKGDTEEWNAAQCMRGDYPVAEQMPDRDLGISTRKLSRLQNIPVEDTRRYGVPSIRTDRNLPPSKSVSNNINWGDELDAKGLLYPKKYDFDGVNSSSFTSNRDLDEIKEVFERMGAGLRDEDYQRLADAAVAEFGALNIDSFRHAWNTDGSFLAQQAAPAPARAAAATGMDAYRTTLKAPTQTSRPVSANRRESAYRNTRDINAVGGEQGLQNVSIHTKKKYAIEQPYRNASTISF